MAPHLSEALPCRRGKRSDLGLIDRLVLVVVVVVVVLILQLK